MIFENLSLRRIVIHEVFQRADDRQVVPPNYGNTLTDLPENGVTALRSRVMTAMGRASKSLEMDIRKTDNGSMLAVVRSLLAAANDDEFVQVSARAADQLADAQRTRTIPGGVLVVFDGEVDHPAKRIIGVIKAEPQNGFTRTRADGRMSLQFLEELLLTPQAKLYKIGVFVETDAARAAGANPVEGFRAFVYDSEMSLKNRDTAALYFYEGFLGCGFQQTSARLTRQFHSLTRDFITKLEIPEEEKADLLTGLYSYLKVDNTPTVEVNQFGQTYLENEHMRDAYNAFMTANEFPEIAVAKDLTEVGPQLRHRRVRFRSEIKLSGPADKFKDLVHIEHVAESPEGEAVEWTRITIRDRILDQE